MEPDDWQPGLPPGSVGASHQSTMRRQSGYRALNGTTQSDDGEVAPRRSGIDGYVTGITYPRRYYRELNPAAISFAALQCGYAPPRLDRPFCYLDLGCGHGYSTTLFASLFPQGRFIGVDFNEQHIASAERLRAAARIDNASFVAATFAEMANTPTPTADCDFIAMHGVMSWVSEAVQRDIATVIERRLKPGGILYVSYNCQPGWAAKMPLRELLMDAYQRANGQTVEERLREAVSLLRRLADSGSQYLAANPDLMPFLDMIEQQEAGYLAHEFLNQHWTVFYHRDMAAQMHASGLSYLGSANAADNIRLLAMPEQPARLVDAMPDIVLRETMRDMVLNRQFRRDLYGRDLKPMPLAPFVEAMRATSFVLARSRAACDLVVKRSFGDVTLDGGVFNPLLDCLARGAAGFDDLSAMAPISGWGLADQNQAVQVLVGADFARPIVAGAGVDGKNAAVQRFNAAARAAAAAAGSDTVTLAEPALSDALTVSVTPASADTQ
jgi:SAM-dependent methyltransferase